MTGFDISELSALEILDSRGRPTLATTLRLGDGTQTRAGVPSGASTGSREAVERRDGDDARYQGLGVLGAVTAVNTELAGLLRGRSWSTLAEADQAMADLDGTPARACVPSPSRRVVASVGRPRESRISSAETSLMSKPVMSFSPVDDGTLLDDCSIRHS
jgi:enolase